MKNILKTLLLLLRAAEWCLIAAVLLIVLLLALGIHPYAVKTGSMEPAIPAGSICFVNQRAAFGEVSAGDIIAFRVGEMLVTHRAVQISGAGIATKGDANPDEDAARVTQESFVGKIVFWVPRAGRVLLFLRTGRGKIICTDVVLLFAASVVIENRLAKSKEESEQDSDAPASSDSDEAGG